ncbi:MAG: type II toxin-antitoxin system HicB family antitoxin [Candidatus Yanofskybacteria bacterium]|nr:type II toxin-antitoxin system HicB family antitoxin [Candidatus Yanofskybacteria bacterium]
MKKTFNSQYSIFPITIEPMGEGGYFAFTETLQGAHAEGETLGEAIDNIKDVIEKHLEVRKEHGENIGNFEIGVEPRISIPLPLLSK